MITQTFFISSGRKNAMYTLKSVRHCNDFYVEQYICNLSTDSAKAEEKARDYFDRIKSRIQETADFKLIFDCTADFSLCPRGALSEHQNMQMELLENGVMPFGKYKDVPLLDLPASTVLWYADQVKDCGDKKSEMVFQAVASRLLGVALDQGYIAKREQVREEIAAANALSQYIGDIKQRLELHGVITAIYATDFGYVNKILVEGNIVIYYGNQLGEKDDKIKFKATVKSHNEYKGTKQTIVNRPKIID